MKTRLVVALLLALAGCGYKFKPKAKIVLWDGKGEQVTLIRVAATLQVSSEGWSSSTFESRSQMPDGLNSRTAWMKGVGVSDIQRRLTRQCGDSRGMYRRKNMALAQMVRSDV